MSIIRIQAGLRDPSILSEMIGLVDKENMQKMMSVGASALNKGKIEISMDMVDKYLERWADAKYDQFLLFDHSLKISESIEFKMTNEQMDFEIDKLCHQYPQYALLLKALRAEDYIANSFSTFRHKTKNADEEYVKSMYESLYLSKGKKISTALSEMIQDKGYEVEREIDGKMVKALHTFDIELSKIMQAKTISGKIYVSIDPCDFLMMSTNQHNWKSCMALIADTTGYNNVVLSKMVDEGSVIGYKCSDEVVPYNLCGFKFDYISMQARYLLFLDKMTGACGSDPGHGGASNTYELREKVIRLLMNQISTHCGVKNEWTSIGTGNQPSDRLSYNDGMSIAYGHKPTMDVYKRSPYYDIGVKGLVCPHCGKEMRDRNNFICCHKK